MMNERLTNYLHIFEVAARRSARCWLRSGGSGRDAHRLHPAKRVDPAGEDGNVQRLESDRAAVQIMTIHRSKGLEAAVVFLYGGYGAVPSDGMYEYHHEQKRILYIGDDKDAKDRRQRSATRKSNGSTTWQSRAPRPGCICRLFRASLVESSGREAIGVSTTGSATVVSDLEGSGKEHLFKLIPFQDRPPGTETDRADRPARSPASWQPPDELLKSDDNSRGICRLSVHRHAGYEVSSYSRMKRAWSGEIDPLERDEFRREAGRELITVASTERELPGGTAAGLMLHEILEKIPFDLTAKPEAKSLETWRVLESGRRGDRRGDGP